MSDDILFLYASDCWKNIGCTLKRCFENEGIFGFKIKHVKEDNASLSSGVVIVPLFERDESDSYSPIGLDAVKEMRKHANFGNNFSTIFLVLSEKDIPHHYNPAKKMSYYARHILKNNSPQKTVFMGEVKYDETVDKYINILKLTKYTSIKDLKEMLRDGLNNGQSKTMGNLQNRYFKMYYEVFLSEDNS